MRYTLEEKKEIISTKPENLDVRVYCKKIGIAYSTYYKWYKEINDIETSKESTSFVDVTNLINEVSDDVIDIELSDITIHVKNDYSESHLLKLIRTLKRL